MKARRAVGRAFDILAGATDEAIGLAGSAMGAAIDRQAYTELPERDGKWPRQFRLVFVAGSAVMVWSLVYFGLKYI